MIVRLLVAVLLALLTYWLSTLLALPHIVSVLLAVLVGIVYYFGDRI